MAVRRGVASGVAVALVLVGLVVVSPLARAAEQPVPGRISTFAGGLGSGPALDIAQRPAALAVYGSTMYVLDRDRYAVRAIDLAAGTERVVAGTGYPGVTGDGGPATSAKIQAIESSSIAVDSSGSLYIAASNRIRRVDAAGRITTVVGNGGYGLSPDGTPALQAMGAHAVAFHPSGTSTSPTPIGS